MRPPKVNICVGVPTRGPGSQLVNAACFLVPDGDARGNHSNAQFILVPAAGPYVQQRGCARALYYLAPGVLVVGVTSEAREGESQVSAKSGVGGDECSVVLVRPLEERSQRDQAD